MEDTFFLVLVGIALYDLYCKVKLNRQDSCELYAQKISDVSKASIEDSVFDSVTINQPMLLKSLASIV